METIAANAMVRARRETRNGREYLVAPISLIVPGVLAGSKGALFYPPDEVAADPSRWNGMPIVYGHPTQNGSHVSARDPDVLDRYEMGRVFRARIDSAGRLLGDGWLDVEAVRRIDPGVLNAVERGQAIEVSTGLFTSNFPAEFGSHHNGEPYDYVARAYIPDHLAVLPHGQRGACSVSDGCGLMVNRDGSAAIDPEPAVNVSVIQRFWSWLTGNCGGTGGTPGPCPGGKTDAASTATADKGSSGEGRPGVLSRMASAIKGKLVQKYNGMVERYGKAGAIATMTGMALLTPVPIPGSSFVPIGIAEAVRAIHGKFTRNELLEIIANAGGSPDIKAMAQEAFQSLQEACKDADEDMPKGITLEGLQKAIEEALADPEGAAKKVAEKLDRIPTANVDYLLKFKLHSKLVPPDQPGLFSDIWVDHVGDNHVVYRKDGKAYKQPYTLGDDGEVSLSGDPVEVKKVEAYHRKVASRPEIPSPDVPGGGSETAAPAAATQNATRFQRPENYDKVRDLPDGRELWAGANDWETGTTWAGIHKSGDKDYQGRLNDPEDWTNIDHKDCLGCKGTLDATGRTDNKACQDYGNAEMEKWAKKVTANAAVTLTDTDRELGTDAAKQKAATGHNPPNWAVDEALWEKAKEAAGKGDYGEGSDTYWAVVAHIYQQMGGEIQGKGKATANTELGEPTENVWNADDLPEAEEVENANPEGHNQYTGGAVSKSEKRDAVAGAKQGVEAAKGAVHEHAAATTHLEDKLVALHWDHPAVEKIHDAIAEAATGTFKTSIPIPVDPKNLNGKWSDTHPKELSHRASDFKALDKAATKAIDEYGKVQHERGSEAERDHGGVMRVLREAKLHATRGLEKVEGVKSAREKVKQAQSLQTNALDEATTNKSRSTCLDECDDEDGGDYRDCMEECLTENTAVDQPEQQSEVHIMSKEETVSWLIANCDCWKGEKDRETLNNLPDEKLTQLKTAAERSQSAQVVANAATKGFRHGDRGYLFDAGKQKFVFRSLTTNAPKKGAMDDPEDLLDEGADEDEEDAQGNKKKKKPTENAVNPLIATPPTYEQWMAQAPKEVREEFTDLRLAANELKEMKKRQAAALIARLTANTVGDTERAKAAVVYNSLSLEQLQELVATLPMPSLGEQNFQPQQQQLPPLYLGASAGLATNARDDSDNLLPPMVFSFEDQASPKLRRKQA